MAMTVVGMAAVPFLFANPVVSENNPTNSGNVSGSAYFRIGDSNASDFEPVDDMHHFMEYVCEPSYKGLKQVLATEPANRQDWKSFKNHALVLAETSALVANRGPEDDAQSKQWKEICLAVYDSGKSLYKSAGKYDEAKKHYGLMIDQCNKCHTVFADGKHQLKK